MHTDVTNKEALKSDLRGIETSFRKFISEDSRGLKSDLRGIETLNRLHASEFG